jgi:uncharacterized protein (TIGR03066 family)
MNLLRFAFLGCLVAAAVSAGTSSPSIACAEEGLAPAPLRADTNKEKIVGTWEVAKSKPPTTIEFTKEGKLKISVKLPNMPPVTLEGTYEVKGDTVTVAVKTPDGKEMKDSLTIVKLTATEMTTTDSKGKKDEYAKKK